MAAVPERSPTSTTMETIGSSATAAFKNLTCDFMLLPWSNPVPNER
jgi:hypothetical protein